MQCWGGTRGLLHARQALYQPSCIPTSLLTSDNIVCICMCECVYVCGGVPVPVHVYAKRGCQVSSVILCHVLLSLGLSQNLEVGRQAPAILLHPPSYHAVPGFLNMGAGPIWWLTTICHSGSRGSDILFWPLWAPGMHVVHRLQIDKTPMYIKNLAKRENMNT